MKKLSERVFTVTNEDLIAIADNNNRPNSEIEELVQELEQWIKDQPHLPNDSETSHIRPMLQLNKFNMEKTKLKIDNYYSYRNYCPNFYQDRDLLSPQMQKVFDNVMLVSMPKLVNKTTRICITRLINDNPADFDLEAIFKLIFAVADVRIHYDLAIQDIFITDLGGLKWRHIFQINPVLIKKAFSIIKNVFSARIAAIHILNCPSYAYALIALTKSILPMKLAKRVYMHDSPDSIKDFIDVEYLPEEFGGQQESLEVIYARWREFIEEHRAWLELESQKKSNEELRPKNDSYMNKFYNLFS